MWSSRVSIYMIAAICIFGSCKSRQVVEPTVERRLSTPIEQTIGMIVSSSAPYQQMSAPLRIKCQIADRSINLSGQISVIQDSLMSLSIRFFGMEVAKLMADSNRCLLINRAGRQYCDLSDGGGYLELLTKMMGNIVMNRLFSEDPNEYTLIAPREIQFKDRFYEGVLSYQLSDNHRITSLSYRSDSWSMRVDYSNFEKLEQGEIELPARIIINGTYGPDKISVEISISQVKIEEPIIVNWSFPSAYQRIAVEDILKLIVR